MPSRLRFAVAALTSLAAALAAPAECFAQACDAGWQCNVSYGASTAMDLYVPKLPAAVPPIVVVLHYCGGNAQAVHSWLQSYSDQYGFDLITPTAGGNCFDATPTRAGERANIAAMVSYTVAKKGADPARVYVMGVSSGACMTQAMLAAYPDVFAAGSSLAGVPAGAWTGGNSYAWSTSGNGMPTTAQGWGDIVRNADKGFTGTRPRVQLWHGQGDTTLTYSQTYPFEVEQWTNVFGVTDADATTTNVKPPGAEDTWARTSYKDGSGAVVVEANSGPIAADHDLASRGLWGDVIRFFGLDVSSTASGGAGGMGGNGAGGAATAGRDGASGAANRAGAPSAGSGGSAGARAGAAGQMNSGGVNAGGKPSITGGAPSTGGTASGGTASSGAPNGGASGASGAKSSGGFATNGGFAGSAGAPNTTGGVTAKGGSASGSGGERPSDTSGNTSTSSNGANGGSNGCGCRVAQGHHTPLGALALFVGAGFGIGARRRYRARR